MDGGLEWAFSLSLARTAGWLLLLATPLSRKASILRDLVTHFKVTVLSPSSTCPIA
jgi:hypothetical protein